MLKLTLKSIRANKARFLLTGVAVLLGVAFMAGTFILTATIKRSYDDISANAIEQYVSRLRKRLSPYGLTVRTARGIGYYLDKLPEAS